MLMLLLLFNVLECFLVSYGYFFPEISGSLARIKRYQIQKLFL